MKKLLLLLVLSLAFSTTYFVAPSGDDSNSGSAQNPFLTIDDQNWEDHVTIISDRNPNNQEDIAGNMLVSINTDSTLTYRGVEIDYLKLLFKPDGLCNKGDLDHDGIINVVDIVRLVNIIFGEEYSGEELCAGDIIGDGILNVLDIVGLVDYIFAN